MWKLIVLEKKYFQLKIRTIHVLDFFGHFSLLKNFLFPGWGRRSRMILIDLHIQELPSILFFHVYVHLPQYSTSTFRLIGADDHVSLNKFLFFSFPEELLCLHQWNQVALVGT